MCWTSLTNVVDDNDLLLRLLHLVAAPLLSMLRCILSLSPPFDGTMERTSTRQDVELRAPEVDVDDVDENAKGL